MLTSDDQRISLSSEAAGPNRKVLYLLHGLPLYGIPIPTFRFVGLIKGLLHDSRWADGDCMTRE